jgi:hypothetical protein
VNRANWFQNYVVKMASVSVKRSVDCAADSRDLQISKMNSFEFSEVSRNKRFMFLN